MDHRGFDRLSRVFSDAAARKGTIKALLAAVPSVVSRAVSALRGAGPATRGADGVERNEARRDDLGPDDPTPPRPRPGGG